ncbi:MAG: GNAT family N-acetyltransferase [Saprospiraceae bacterium]
MEFKRYFGQQISEVLTSLGELRITVFRAYPYLYEGSLDYEKNYLQTYVNSPEAMLFSVWDGPQMVGATTCIPLRDETEEVREPFEQAGLPIDSIFYFGESILLPAYRGKGLGKRFFAEREQHAASSGRYQRTYFCGVERPDDHPLRPANYHPLDPFWKAQGYQPAGLVSYFQWLDIGEAAETEKKMNYWWKGIG